MNHRTRRINSVHWLLIAAAALAARTSHAIGFDLLGEVTKPLFGEAKDKTEGALKYIWLQPYGGYAFGSGQSQDKSAAGVASGQAEISYESFFYGARGGIEISNTFRIGVDYTRLPGKREETQTVGAASVTTKSDSLTSMLGIGIGFDVPHTPVEAFGARYVQAELQAARYTSGSGWGGGISFVLVNPFILIAEYRTLTFNSSVAADGSITSKTMKQGLIAISFLML